MSTRRPRVLLLQLPIPPAGPEPIRGNVPLAGAYLKLFLERRARRRGEPVPAEVDLFPVDLANGLGDEAMVDAVVERAPDVLGLTCYLWNIDRSLWLAARVHERLPGCTVVVGGPEITTDNAWVLASPAVQVAVFGEGEQTFAAWLDRFVAGADATGIDGLGVRPAPGAEIALPIRPRTPLADIDVISSPYLDGILDAGDSESLLLETSRGCIFKCKFCYYPKAYDRQYFLSPELVEANLAHARARGARDVFLLDPTLNQRPDFADLVELLARGNPDRSLAYHAELRGEGLTPALAAAMARAGFEEVEIGLQSTDPRTQDLMQRRNNLKAFERGVRALRAEGIRVKVDLIVGLPGDTEETVRRGMEWVAERDLVDDAQVFQLSILPGTAFRREAADLGLEYQPFPPYAVLGTPTLDLDTMRALVEESEEIFGTSFDPLPPPWVGEAEAAAPGLVPGGGRQVVRFAGDPGRDPLEQLPDLEESLRAHLRRNPFSTVLVEVPAAGEFPLDVLDRLEDALHERSERVYLDRYHEWTPGSPPAARRIAVVLDEAAYRAADPDWLEAVAAQAELVRGRPRAPGRLQPGERAGEWVGAG